MPNADTQQLLVDLRLRDQLTGPTAVAKAELKALEASVGGAQTKVAGLSTSMGGLGTSLSSIVKLSIGTLGAFTAIGAATDLFSGAIKGAIDEEASLARLNESLKANVTNREGATEAINRQIKANQDLGFTDDATRDSLTGLVAATHSVSEAIADQNVAMDLARFKNISLAEASDALVKVEGGRYRLLASLGIELGANATKEEALAAVRAVAAGQAKAFGETTAGAAEQAAAAFDDASDALGEALLPLLKETAGIVKNDLAPALHDVAGGVAEFVKFGNDIAGVFNEIVELGPKVHDAIFGARPSAADIAGEQAATKAAQDYATELRRIDAAVADGTITQEEAAAATTKANDAYRVAIGVAGGLTRANGQVTDSLKIGSDTALTAAESQRDLSGGYDLAARSALALTIAVGTSKDATVEQKQAATDAMAVFKQLGTVFDGFNSVVDQSAAASDHFGFANRAAMDKAIEGMGGAYKTAADLKDKINELPDDKLIVVTIETRTRTIAEGAGGRNVAEKVGAAADPASANDPAVAAANTAFLNDQAARDKAFADARAAAAKQARDRAASEALSAAKEQARKEAAAYKDALDNAFEGAKRTANSLFDTLHNRHLQAIKDAETLAQKNHDTALQQIADALKAQQAKNAAPVNAAESALRDRQAAQQRRDLVEAQQTASAAVSVNRDPAQVADLARQLRSATEALVNFDAQAAIDRLKVVQGGLDATAQGVADKATAAADAQLAVAKKQAQAEQDAETVANQKRRQDFETQLKALRERDEKAGKSRPQVKADIDALGRRFGIVTDPRTGAHHIEDPLIGAIKTIRDNPPQLTVNLSPTLKFQLGVREFVAALAAQNQPAATAAVRTGAAGRSG